MEEAEPDPPGAENLTSSASRSSPFGVAWITTYVARVATADKPASLAGLAVGENVVIHATPKGDDLEADEVRFSAPSASGSGSSKTQQ